MRACLQCGAELPLRPGPGRLPKYDSRACRQAAYRSRQRAASAAPIVAAGPVDPAVIPGEMLAARRWVRADGKRPIRVDGRAASSTDPGTWSTWSAVTASRAGDGLGFMLGAGVGVYDLDSVSDDQAAAFLATVPEQILFVERSVSGRGVHVFIVAVEGAGWRRWIGGVSVERYTRGRFIRVTGVAF